MYLLLLSEIFKLVNLNLYIYVLSSKPEFSSYFLILVL